jgi:hypothetical protein
MNTKRRIGSRSLMNAVCGAAIIASLAGVAARQASAALIEHSHSQGIGYANISFDSGSSTTSSYLGRFIMAPITPLPAGYPTYSINTVHGPETGFFSYCVEPLQPIGVGHGPSFQYDFTIGALAGTGGLDAGDAALVQELFGRYCPLLQNDPSGPYSGGTFRTAAAAMQLAIWKINLDRTTETLGAWDFSSGLMQLAGGAVPLESGASATADVVAILMLNSLTGSGPMASGLEGLRNPDIQDLLIQQVPEPGAAVLLGLGGLTSLSVRPCRRGRRPERSCPVTRP